MRRGGRRGSVASASRHRHDRRRAPRFQGVREADAVGRRGLRVGRGVELPRPLQRRRLRGRLGGRLARRRLVGRCGVRTLRRGRGRGRAAQRGARAAVAGSPCQGHAQVAGDAQIHLKSRRRRPGRRRGPPRRSRRALAPRGRRRARRAAAGGDRGARGRAGEDDGERRVWGPRGPRPGDAGPAKRRRRRRGRGRGARPRRAPAGGYGCRLRHFSPQQCRVQESI
mmetsp:Transcript_19234/g.59204  ORF Transcript_19234/g.59204 Transcript_19234/m.59204 type:complete len:225 (+) Transcript_19234:281-955(+)